MTDIQILLCEHCNLNIVACEFPPCPLKGFIHSVSKQHYCIVGNDYGTVAEPKKG